MHLENLLDYLAVVPLQTLESLDHASSGVQRQRSCLPVAKPTRPEQGVQVDHVIGVLVSDDDGVNALANGRPGELCQSSIRAVPEVKHDPETSVLEHKAAARQPWLRRSAATAKHDKTEPSCAVRLVASLSDMDAPSSGLASIQARCVGIGLEPMQLFTTDAEMESPLRTVQPEFHAGRSALSAQCGMVGRLGSVSLPREYRPICEWRRSAESAHGRSSSGRCGCSSASGAVGTAVTPVRRRTVEAPRLR